MITVIAAIIHHQGQLLIARRASHKSLAGFWEFPGGKLEFGETAEMCLIREIYEELQIRITVEDFFCTTTHNYGSFEIELQTYHCTYVTGDVQLIDHDAYDWASSLELGNYLWAPADLPIVSLLQATRSTSS
jgi:8-oxo-dGTP diphosphatase